jgi:hypothetical protein
VLQQPDDIEQALERGDPRRAPRDPDPSVDRLGGDLLGRVALEREAVVVLSRRRSRCRRSAICVGPDPSPFITQTRSTPVRSGTKAISLPSGDKAGNWLFPSFVSCARPVPSALTT